MKWVCDEHGNRASIEHWGSEWKARASLRTLRNCSDCSRCSDCSTSASNVPVTPVIKSIHQAVYAAASLPKALDMATWHTCQTTHSRAGWVVHLAGEAGKQLEDHFGTLLAAMKIYDASDPNYRINPCRFFDDNTTALACLQALALAEGSK